MSNSEDINTLFRRFGGDADSYQEIVSIGQADSAERHWPLLGQLKPLANTSLPAAKRTAEVSARMAQVEVVIYKEPPRAEPVFQKIDGGAFEEQKLSHVDFPVPDILGHTDVQVEAATLLPSEADVPAILRSRVESVVENPTPPVVPEVKSDLKNMFERMVVRTPEMASPVSHNPLKRLVKW